MLVQFQRDVEVISQELVDMVLRQAQKSGSEYNVENQEASFFLICLQKYVSVLYPTYNLSCKTKLALSTIS